MRILKIETQNLASLAGEQVIDFTQSPLREANLYAITGDTGAGKSTLLDAICLALYGQTPRLVEAKGYDKEQGETTHIMRRGSTACYARVTFAIGGKHYRSTWTVYRKRTGKLSTPLQRIEQLVPTHEVLYEKEGKTTNDLIVSLTGLTYDQFTRTVLLAQNSFATFLKAKASDKAQLLEKITGTEIYKALSLETHQRLQEANLAVKNHESMMAGVAKDTLLDAQTADALRTNLLKLRTQQADTTTQRQRVEKLLRWYTDRNTYEQALNTAEAHYHTAVQQRNQKATEAARLARYDSVQHLRDDYRAAERLKADVATWRTAFANTQASIDQLTASHKDATDHRHKAMADLHNATQLRQQRTPAIEQGLRLQSKIDTLNTTLHDTQIKADKLQKQCAANHITLKARQDELHEIQTALTAIDQYFDHNNRHQRMVIRFDRLEQQLEQLMHYNEEVATCANKRSELLAQQATIAQQHKAATEHHNATLQRVAAAEAELHHEQQRIAGQQADALLAKQQTLHTQVVLLADLQPLWERIVAQSHKYAEYTLNIDRTRKELAQINLDLPLAKQQRDTCNKNATRLQELYYTSKNIDVEKLRHTLESGKPCPVCGSGHHPWHTEQAQLAQKMGLLTEGLRSEVEAAEQEANNAQQHYDRLNSDKTKAETSLNNYQNAAKALRTLLDTDWDTWHTKGTQVLGLETKYDVGNDHEVRLRLQQLHDQQTEAAKIAQQAVTQYNATQTAIHSKQRALETLRNDTQLAKEALQKIEQQTIENRAAQDRNTATHQVAYDKATQLARTIDDELSIDDWQANIERTITLLKNIHREWQSKAKEQAQLHTQQAEATAQLAKAQTQTKADETQAAGLAEQIELYRKEIFTLQQQLMADFPNRTPSEEQKHLTATEQQCRTQFEMADQALKKIDNALQVALGQHNEKERTLTVYEQEYTEAETRLLRGINDFNQHHTMLQTDELRNLFDDPIHWQTLRTTIATLDKACDEAKHTRDDAATTLNALLTATDRPEGEDETPQALNARDTELASTLTALNDEIQNSTYALRRHDETVAKLSQHTQQYNHLKQNADHWRALDALIGGHEGTRFSNQVQAYTFQFLIARANIQLAQISRRYRLLADADQPLSLQVEDIDLGGERRPAASLSGGETFIVSLALALALTDLSTGTHRIESLFIDEGFGTLDNTSLALVMQTLDRLHSTQNRQVGIISHAEAIRQQVHPRIEVLRTNRNGASQIVVST